MAAIAYRVGDVLDVEDDPGPWVVAHVCNDAGGWGKGFVVSLSRRWAEPERAYRAWAQGTLSAGAPFGLGKIQPVAVGGGHWVVNMVAQRGYAKPDNRVAIDYGALSDCLGKTAIWASAHDARVRMPRIGCGLAGGSWGEIVSLIERTLVAGGLDVVVYDLSGKEQP